MREIRFRVWDEAECLMYEFDFREYMNSIESRQEELCPTLALDHVMQYTGLKDKNGKEIYEGDIVADEAGNAAPVEWVQDHCQFLWMFEGDIQEIGPWCEVISNIWEDKSQLRESEG